jgi:hypothetical protein
MNPFNDGYNHLGCHVVLSGRMLTCQRNIHPPLSGTQFDPEDGGSKLLRHVGEMPVVHLLKNFRAVFEKIIILCWGTHPKRPQILEVECSYSPDRFIQ